MTEPLVVYTDGACLGNPGPGGWAWLTESGLLGVGGATSTTNNRMELQAVLQALISLPRADQIVVYSDSKYVVDCFLQKWYIKWEECNFRRPAKKGGPVANADLWVDLLKYWRARPWVDFRWVRGHSGHPMNEKVDALAFEQATYQKNSLTAQTH